MAPALAWKVSSVGKNEDHILSPSQHIFLQLTARKTWTYFERFVTEEDNWLPPDNYQEQPVAVLPIALRPPI
jgi:cyclic beta-1,2-glucan synthetase